MKSFTFSLMLFVLTIGVILCNTIYIKRITFALLDGLESIPEPESTACAGVAHELTAYWERHISFVALSACDSLTERISEQLSLLTVCAEQGDRYGFYQVRASLCNTVEDLRRPETLSLRFF